MYTSITEYFCCWGLQVKSAQMYSYWPLRSCTCIIQLDTLCRS